MQHSTNNCLCCAWNRNISPTPQGFSCCSSRGGAAHVQVSFGIHAAHVHIISQLQRIGTMGNPKEPLFAKFKRKAFVIRTIAEMADRSASGFDMHRYLANQNGMLGIACL
jgi:hypothetical protein